MENSKAFTLFGIPSDTDEMTLFDNPRATDEGNVLVDLMDNVDARGTRGGTWVAGTVFNLRRICDLRLSWLPQSSHIQFFPHGRLAA